MAPTLPPPPPPSVPIPHPSTVVPYLFGALAAMLALIALALFILASSYLRRTANMQRQRQREDDPESGGFGLKLENSGSPAAAVLKETVLVIMAGDVKPSFLGTAVSMSGDECCCGHETDIQGIENQKEEA